MPALVIADIQVHDPDAYEEYKQLAPPAIAECGGRYLARGGRVEVLEGDWQPGRLVVLAFDSVEQARDWLNSPEYADARAIRLKSASTRMIVVETL